MPDHDELDTRLNGLRAMPPAALPGAAAARARGRQRTRRTRAALAGAGSLVVVLALTAGAALSANPDRITAPPAGGGPSGSAEEEGLTLSLLEAEDVAAVRDEAWKVRPTDDLPFDPLPPGCRGAEEVVGTPFASALRFFDGPDPLVTGHSLKAYAEESAAAEAFDRLIDSHESCAGSASRLFGGLPGSGPTRVYGSYVQADFAVDFAVERVGAVLSGLALRSARPASHLEELPSLADAAAEEVRDGPFVDPEPEPSPGRFDTFSALLSPADAEAVEPGTWSVEYVNPLRLLDPCGAAQAFPSHVDASSAELQWEGGARVAQTVYAFDSVGEAAAALAAHRDAVRACPREDTADGSTSYDLTASRAEQLVVRIGRECERCQDPLSYAVVRQVDEGLAVLVVTTEENEAGDASPRRYGDVAAARLPLIRGG